MQDVVVLGGSGMLGSVVTTVLARDKNLSVRATVRSPALQESLARQLGSVAWSVLDAASCQAADLEKAIGGAKWVVNAIGTIKPYIHDDNAVEVENATRINALFPHLLAQAAAKTQATVVQIATDCVYSGKTGNYNEKDAHDALDVYGKTKSIGEVHSPRVAHLRCSIIGPELKGHLSLLDWFRKQPQGAKLNGYTNHEWNGVTTLTYGRLCHGIIKEGLTLGHLQHVVPKNRISKAALLRAFAASYKRDDLQISDVAAATVIDRTLSTNDADKNAQLWRTAGYASAPTIEEMVGEMARYDYQLAL